MFTHLYRMGPFSEPHTRVYVSEVTLALGHLHSLGIVYRDIKLENLLLDREGHVVLTDFGLSKEMLPEQVSSLRLWEMLAHSSNVFTHCTDTPGSDE